MKILTAIFTLALLIGLNTLSSAQAPPPPPPTEGHGLLGSQHDPNSAPVGDGVYILIGLVGLYASKKVYDNRKVVNS